MGGYVERFDLWHIVATLIPLATALVGGTIVTRWSRHLGKVVVAYSAICVAVSLGPRWLRMAELIPEGPLRPVLLPTKIAFIVGILFVLVAAGRAIQRERARTA